MQITDIITEMNEEVNEEKIEKNKKKLNFSWVLLQIIVCFLLLISVFILKNYFSISYESLYSEYGELVEKTMMTEDGEINFVQGQ